MAHTDKKVQEIFGDNLRRIREHMGLSQKEMAMRLMLSGSQYREWEKGRTDIRISKLENVAFRLKVPKFALLEPNIELAEEKPKPMPKPYDFDMRIYSMEDRLTVIGILAKNGYDVGQHKRQRTPTGKVLDYYVHAKLLEGNADTSK